MSISVIRTVTVLALFAAGVVAQDAPAKETAKAAPKTEVPKAAAPEAEQAKTPQPTKKKKKEPRRVLRPEEVPGELMRLNTKADIKAVLKIRTYAGRPVLFSGVIRNGKLIERLIDRRFVPQKTVGHPRCGVRIWWAGNSDGYIFFRYSTIETLTITGKLSAEERREIMRRLKAKREGRTLDEPKKDAPSNVLDAAHLEKIENMGNAEREAFLLTRFPPDKGWSPKRYRELKRSKIIDQVTLSPEQELFVKYFRQLEDARYQMLRDAPRKVEKFEPGSAEDNKKDSPETAAPPEKAGDE